MPDFRVRQQVPTQSIVNTGAQAAQRREPVSNVLTGVEQGFKLSGQVGEMVERRKRAKLTAELLANPTFTKKLGPLAPIVANNPEIIGQLGADLFTEEGDMKSKLEGLELKGAERRERIELKLDKGEKLTKEEAALIKATPRLTRAEDITALLDALQSRRNK